MSGSLRKFECSSTINATQNSWFVIASTAGISESLAEEGGPEDAWGGRAGKIRFVINSFIFTKQRFWRPIWMKTKSQAEKKQIKSFC